MYIYLPWLSSVFTPPKHSSVLWRKLFTSIFFSPWIVYLHFFSFALLKLVSYCCRTEKNDFFHSYFFLNPFFVCLPIVIGVCKRLAFSKINRTRRRNQNGRIAQKNHQRNEFFEREIVVFDCLVRLFFDRNFHVSYQHQIEKINFFLWAKKSSFLMIFIRKKREREKNNEKKYYMANK